MKVLVLVVALLLPTAAVAGKCDEDKQKFCKDVIEAKGDVQACLQQHLSELSADCKAKQEKKAKKAVEQKEQKDKDSATMGKDEAQPEANSAPATGSDTNQVDQPTTSE